MYRHIVVFMCTYIQYVCLARVSFGCCVFLSISSANQGAPHECAAVSAECTRAPRLSLLLNEPTNKPTSRPASQPPRQPTDRPANQAKKQASKRASEQSSYPQIMSLVVKDN